MALRPKISPALHLACSLVALMTPVAEAEHITIDGHSSPARTIPGPNYSIGDALDKPGETPTREWRDWGRQNA